MKCEVVVSTEYDDLIDYINIEFTDDEITKIRECIDNNSMSLLVYGEECTIDLTFSGYDVDIDVYENRSKFLVLENVVNLKSFMQILENKKCILREQ